ncbi:helix-turn-helix domain-containing protein [Nocardia sp. SYP-A9097]|uniref:helix-turn-helix domain-containing protein n=1 Tax=Nocardia sp. SYP-A9097 TaxID=2663237 RepID=UPI001890D819|nr:helix-turn-helix transcriptional regulator [Nocardia sp. SYP-A9097]
MLEPEHPGRRIAKYRKLRGMTQTKLAMAAGVSKNRLAKVETGAAAASSVWIGAVANALGVEADLIYGIDNERPRLDGTIPAVRRVLASTDLLPSLEPDSLEQLRPLVEQVVRWRHAAAYAKLTKVLPDLAEQLLVAGERDGAPAYVLLTSVYRAANTLSHKLGHNDLSMLATDRMVWAAERSADPLLLATTQYVKSAALARIGATAQAIRLTDRTIADIEPYAADDTAAAVLCALHMRRAGLACLAGDSDTTDTHFGAAGGLAERVGDRQVLGTIVGPTNLRLWELNAAVDLGRVAEAQKIAKIVRLPAEFPRERSAHYWLDTARAHLAAGKPDDAVDALQEARSIAPEYFRNARAVKTTLEATAEQQRRASNGLRALSNYAGLKD